MCVIYEHTDGTCTTEARHEEYILAQGRAHIEIIVCARNSFTRSLRLSLSSAASAPMRDDDVYFGDDGAETLRIDRKKEFRNLCFARNSEYPTKSEKSTNMHNAFYIRSHTRAHFQFGRAKSVCNCYIYPIVEHVLAN